MHLKSGGFSLDRSIYQQQCKKYSEPGYLIHVYDLALFVVVDHVVN